MLYGTICVYKEKAGSFKQGTQEVEEDVTQEKASRHARQEPKKAKEVMLMSKGGRKKRKKQKRR